MKSDLRLGDEATGRKLLAALPTHTTQEAIESVNIMTMFAENRFLKDPDGEPATLREFEHYRWMSAIPQLIDWVANLDFGSTRRLVEAHREDQANTYAHLTGAKLIPGVPEAPTPKYRMLGLTGVPRGPEDPSQRLPRKGTRKANVDWMHNWHSQ